MNEYWEKAKVEDAALFFQQVSQACQSNAQAATLLEEQNILLVSTDEKCGIQALQRDAPDLPCTAQHSRKQEFNYQRHGTQSLIGGLEVATGQVYVQLGDQRTEQDYADFISYIAEHTPQKYQLLIMADQLNTHKSATLVELAAKLNKDEQDLGKKGKYGILKNMPSRMAYLETGGPRLRLCYTPKHCSWLNLIEVWFSQLRCVKKEGQ